MSTWKSWTNLELWTLLTIYRSDMDELWEARAAKEMENTRNLRVEKRPRGFYTADKCKEQLARIMNEPCPFEVPTGIEYSRAAIVDGWIKYYSEQERQDAAVYSQLMNVKIRSYEERLMAAWGNRDKFTTEQLEAMLEEIKKEEEEVYSWSATQTSQDLHENCAKYVMSKLDMFLVEYDEEEAEKLERLGAIYYKHVADLFYKQRNKNISPSHMSSQQSSSDPLNQNLTIDTGQHTLESSPHKSSVVNSPHEVSDVGNVVKLEEDQKEKVDVNDSVLSSGLESANSPSKDLSQSDNHTKRLRSRLPKKDSSTPNRDTSPSIASHSEGAKSPTRSETLRSNVRNETTATLINIDKDPIQVVDSPAGRVRGARRPAAVESPLSKTSNAGRTSAGADLKDVKDGSKERETIKRRHSTDVAIHPTFSSQTNIDEFGGTASQTAVSFQTRSWGSLDGAVSSSRKSRNDRRCSSTTTTISASSSHDVAVQTDQIKIDFDENIIVQSPVSEIMMLPTTSLPLSNSTENEVVVKAAHCENDLDSRVVAWDDILDSNISRKSYNLTFTEDRSHMYEVSYSEFSEQAWQAVKNIVPSKNLSEKSSLSLLMCTPSKKMRKEEKTSGSALTPKGRMMSTWNLLQEHRHSAIFLHPVTDRDAPGYSYIVNCPVDLTTMKREIDSGAIINPNMMLRRVFMMFANAVMFNSTGHDVNFYAKEMCKAVAAECCFTIDPRMDTYRVHHRRSRTEDVKRRSTATPTATKSRTPVRKRK